VQESVNNIVKHSKATEAQVTITKNGSRLEITVRDNGRGIDRDSSSNDMRPAGGFGLIDIAERVRMLGGRHSLQSVPGAGTTITVQISLPEKKDED
jgi:two-component system sensor histidine kinase DegS